MIYVKFFASLRETLNTSSIEMPWRDGLSVGDVLDELKHRGEKWSEALSSPNLLVAVNQHHSQIEHRLNDGDEVAFFPPVTGG